MTPTATPLTTTLRLSRDGSGLILNYLMDDGRFVTAWVPIEGRSDD